MNKRLGSSTKSVPIVHQLNVGFDQLVKQDQDQFPECTNICVTTDDKLATSTIKTPLTTNTKPPVGFEVITVVEPITPKLKRQSQCMKNIFRSLRLQHRKSNNFCKNIFFYSPKHLQKRNKKELLNKSFKSHPQDARQKSTATDQQNFEMTSIFEFAKETTPNDHMNKSNSLFHQQIRKTSQTLENLKNEMQTSLNVSSAFKPVSPKMEILENKAIMGQKSENEETEDYKIQPSRFQKKKRKKKNQAQLPKKVNLRNFTQKIPVTGTNYTMELYLGPEIIDRTRKGKFNIAKEPKIEISTNRSSDLRDEFASYCGQKKKLKNWLYYV
ncbi:hypothetical protein PGB90_006660 [Kerria lacca]